MSHKILHIGSAEKFMPSFIKLVKENFDFNCHEFCLSKGMAEKDLPQSDNIHLLPNKKRLSKLKHYSQILIKMHQADKIILHSLADNSIIKILFFMPWLLKRCYWVIWGGDLYTYQFGKRNRKWRVREFYRRLVIKHMGHLLTYVEGDIELARKWYDAQGEYHESLMYISNLYKTLEVPKNRDCTINIQLGNSANPTNNHIEVLKMLLPFRGRNICIYAPLSYSNQDHAKKVIETGKALFGNKFIPLTEFIPFDDYLDFLGKIDIAIFNNSRQQAMGNIITLLGLGKTVYLRDDTTQWQFFINKGLQVYNVNNFNSLDIHYHTNNVSTIKNYFSEATLIQQLSRLF